MIQLPAKIGNPLGSANYFVLIFVLHSRLSYLCAMNHKLRIGGTDMKTSVAMENLWLYLQSLPKSNKKWLSEKLQEDLHSEKGWESVMLPS